MKLSLPARIASLIVSEKVGSSLHSSAPAVASEPRQFASPAIDSATGSAHVVLHAPVGIGAKGPTDQASALQKAASKTAARLAQQVISKLPHLPAELSLNILDQASLNPLQLMALMTTGNASDVPHSLQHSAGLNTYWAAFTPSQDITENAPEGAYAQAFVARYQAMTPKFQTLLFDLWAGKVDAMATFRRLVTAKTNSGPVRAALKSAGRLLQYVAPAPRFDRTNLAANFDLVRAALSQTGGSLRYAANLYRGNREVVLAAVSQYGCMLELADPTLRGDRQLVLAAVNQFGHALKCADPVLRDDREVVLAAVRNYGLVLGYAGPAPRGDREVVLAAVSTNGYALQYAGPALRGDREVVLAAVSQDGYALRYAEPALRGDPELVRLASGA